MPVSKRSRRLKGQRGCLIWLIVLVLIGVPVYGVYVYRADVPAWIEPVREMLLTATPTPAPTAAEFETPIRLFRRAEEAVMKKALDSDLDQVMGALSVFATGRALQKTQDEVAMLQADNRWQELQLEELGIEQILEESPSEYRLQTEEVYRRRIFEQQNGVDSLVADEHYQVGGAYVLEKSGDGWIVSDYGWLNNRVDLP